MGRLNRSTISARAVTGALAVTLVATFALNVAATSAAHAAGPWSAPVSIDGTNELFSVSCASTQFCAAVGYTGSSGHALTFRNGNWSSPVTVGSNPLYAVSCTTDFPFCEAIDFTFGPTNATEFNGAVWSAPSSVDGTDILTALSCFPGDDECLGVGANGNSLFFNGSSWDAPSSEDPGQTLASISCPIGLFCGAVDSAGNALTGGGPVSIDSAALTSVSCQSISFCVAVDAVGKAMTYGGGPWTSPVDVDGSNDLTSVSCPTTSFCMAVDTTGHALTYNGSTWSGPSDIDGTNQLNSVSCPSAGFCLAVDNDGHVLTYETAFHVATTSLPSATRGVAYTSTQLTAFGGTAPYKWKKLGALPKGLKLSSSGVLSGTPKTKDAAGTYSVDVQVKTKKTKTSPSILATKTLSLVLS